MYMRTDSGLIPRQDPMAGGRDELVDSIASAVLGYGVEHEWPRVAPQFILRIGRYINPF